MCFFLTLFIKIQVIFINFRIPYFLAKKLGEAMALKVLNKINSRLKFLYRKNRYLTQYLKRLLCNAIIPAIS